MKISFEDKVVVVTGGAKGIGAATVRMFHDSGATVIGLDVAAVEVTGGKHHSYVCDVSSFSQVKDVFKNIEETFGRVDVLVNNAGIQTYGKVADMEEEVWDKTINVNLKSVYLCSKFAIPLMQKSKSPVIINVASVQALVSEENVAAYVASKSGMLGLTRSIAIDYAPHIRCVAVCPGAVNTEMLAADLKTSDDPDKLLEYTRNIHLLKRIADPAEVASMILYLASEYASFSTGAHYRIDGGIGNKIVVQ